MSKFDIGLAMVAARIATSEMEKEEKVRKRMEQLPRAKRTENKAETRKSSLPGVKLEVINGELILIPSVQSPRYSRGKGWTLTREDGSVMRIDTGEIVSSPENER